MDRMPTLPHLMFLLCPQCVLGETRKVQSGLKINHLRFVRARGQNRNRHCLLILSNLTMPRSCLIGKEYIRGVRAQWWKSRTGWARTGHWAADSMVYGEYCGNLLKWGWCDKYGVNYCRYRDLNCMPSVDQIRMNRLKLEIQQGLRTKDWSYHISWV